VSVPIPVELGTQRVSVIIPELSFLPMFGSMVYNTIKMIGFCENQKNRFKSVGIKKMINFKNQVAT
jgi:hypothetical protein